MSASASTLHTSALALCYSVAIICARSSYTKLVDNQLNNSMQVKSRHVQPNQLPWLLVLANVASAEHKRRQHLTLFWARYWFTQSGQSIPRPACWPAKLKPSYAPAKHGHKLLNGGRRLNGGTKHRIDIH